MSVEKTRHPRGYYEEEETRRCEDLEAQYKSLGTAAVRAASIFKPCARAGHGKKKVVAPHSIEGHD